MIEGPTFKVAHDASPKATPAEGHRNMNACQLRGPLGKKPHSAAAHRLSTSNSDDQKPRGKDQVVARLVSKDRIDFGSRGWPTPVPTDDVLPIGPQGLLSESRRRVNRDHSRNAMRRSHRRSLTTERAVGTTMSSIDSRRRRSSSFCIEEAERQDRQGRLSWPYSPTPPRISRRGSR
jgi:hypothetical protein